MTRPRRSREKGGAHTSAEVLLSCDQSISPNTTDPHSMSGPVVAVHHVGGDGVDESERKITSGWKTIRVVVHKFTELPQTRHQAVYQAH